LYRSSIASILRCPAAVRRSTFPALILYLHPPTTPFCQYSHGFSVTKQNPQIAPSESTSTPHHQQKQQRIRAFSHQQLPTQRVCCGTSSRIAATSARSLPALAAHLSGWTHRLRPTALRACPCTQHSSQDTTIIYIYSTRSQVPRDNPRPTFSILHSHIHRRAMAVSPLAGMFEHCRLNIPMHYDDLATLSPVVHKEVLTEFT